MCSDCQINARAIGLPGSMSRARPSRTPGTGRIREMANETTFRASHAPASGRRAVMRYRMYRGRIRVNLCPTPRATLSPGCTTDSRQYCMSGPIRESTRSSSFRNGKHRTSVKGVRWRVGLRFTLQSPEVEPVHCCSAIESTEINIGDMTPRGPLPALIAIQSSVL